MTDKTQLRLCQGIVAIPAGLVLVALGSSDTVVAIGLMLGWFVVGIVGPFAFVYWALGCFDRDIASDVERGIRNARRNP
jgi:uncharacterized membrane protein YedE/YeeE